MVFPSKSAKEIWEKLEKFYGNEEKKDVVTSSANLISSSNVDADMAHEESKVSSNSYNSNSYSYSFDELQDAFDELFLEFQIMNSKFKKMISKLKLKMIFF
ncbi:hypothetical protein GQ457_01G015600 [Hibiscus cannabinus]